MWPSTIALPFRITQSEMMIQWDELIFNNHILDPVPEEGVSRLVTQQTSARQVRILRILTGFELA